MCYTVTLDCSNQACQMAASPHLSASSCSSQYLMSPTQRGSCPPERGKWRWPGQLQTRLVEIPEARSSGIKSLKVRCLPLATRFEVDVECSSPQGSQVLDLCRSCHHSVDYQCRSEQFQPIVRFVLSVLDIPSSLTSLRSESFRNSVSRQPARH